MHRSALISCWGPVCPACAPPATQKDRHRRRQDLSVTSDEVWGAILVQSHHKAAGSHLCRARGWGGEDKVVLFRPVEAKGLVARDLLSGHRGLWQFRVWLQESPVFQREGKHSLGATGWRTKTASRLTHLFSLSLHFLPKKQPAVVLFQPKAEFPWGVESCSYSHHGER